MTQRRHDHQYWPIVPDAEPDDLYCPERYKLERTTTAFLTLLWRQWQIAEKEASRPQPSTKVQECPATKDLTSN